MWNRWFLQENGRQHRSCWTVCRNWNIEDMDSAGLAVRDGESLAEVVKAKGRLTNLVEKTDAGKA